jgi:nanoRNase/pAp phosphatase (c-di-AMP/oligoRNAs hydrolase)
MLVVGAIGGRVDALSSALREDPLLAAAAMLAVLVVFVLVGVLFRWLRRTPAKRFERLLRSLDSAVVLMHPNPDPDAMASALAVGQLAQETDTETRLCYSGQIRRPENRAFETVIGANFERVEKARSIASDPVILVDHNEPRGFADAGRIDPVAVVDHHPGDGGGSTFTDVRTDSGACATILSGYLSDLGWTPADPDVDGTSENAIPSTVATGLLYGIQSDTKSLTNGCSDADFRAASFLYQGVDEEKLDRIANPEVDPEVLDVKACAISDREVRNAFVISDVGTVSNGDAVPEAADELLRLEGVTAVVVLADKGEELRISGRSRDDRVHMGNSLERAVSPIPESSAGGHERMGGGQIPLNQFVETRSQTGELLTDGERFTREEFRERLFDVMRGEL